MCSSAKDQVSRGIGIQGFMIITNLLKRQQQEHRTGFNPLFKFSKKTQRGGGYIEDARLISLSARAIPSGDSLQIPSEVIAIAFSLW